jgi:hypothetical protein
VIDSRHDSHPAGCPIEHDSKIHKAARHWDLGDVSAMQLHCRDMAHTWFGRVIARPRSRYG